MQCRLDVRGLNHCQGPQKPDTGSRPLPAHVSVVQAALRQSRLPAQPGDASVGRSGSSRVARPAGSGRQQRAGQSVSIAEAPVQPTVEHLHHVPASGPTENGMLSNDRLQQHLQQHQRTTGPVLLTFPFTMHQLLALKATTWAGSMDKAAGLLGVTKNNVAILISKLEKEFNVQLLIRTKGMPPQATPAGALLLRYADRLLTLGSDAVAAAKDLQDTTMGTMTVAASQTTGVYLMPTLIEKYKRTHQQVAVQLQVDNTTRCCQAVANGDVDIAVVGGAIPSALEHLVQVTHYQDDEVVIVCSGKSKLAGRAMLHKDELMSLQWVSLFKSSTVQAIKTTLEREGINWKAMQVVLEVNSVEAIKQAVEANLGVAFVSNLALQKERQLGRLHVLRIQGIPLVRSLRCVTDPVRYCSRAVQAFIREMFGLTIDTTPEGCIVDGSEMDSSHRNGHQRCLPASHTYGNGAAPHGCEGSAWPVVDLHKSALRNGLTISFASAHWVGGKPRSADSVEESDLSLPEERLPFTLAQVAALLTVARTGSTRSAALALSISQPAVSKSLSGLEQVFGMPLIARNHRNGPAWLTEEGQVLLPYCRSMLAVASEACKAMQECQAASVSVVSLGASQTVGTYVMPRLVAAFKRNNSQVSVQMHVDSSRAICSAVAKGEVDIAIIGGEVPEELRDLVQAVPYAQDEIVLLVPHDHELARRGTIDKSELYNLNFVSLHQGNSSRATQERLLQEQDIQCQHLKIDMELNSIEAIKSAVHHGLGVAFVSASAISKEVELGLACKIHVHGLRLRLRRTLQVISNPRREYPRMAQRFMVEIFNVKSDSRVRSARQQQSSLNALQHSEPAPRPWEQQKHRHPR